MAAWLGHVGVGPVEACAAEADACHAGLCVSLGPLEFECQAAAKAVGTACDDGDACTGTDTCKVGQCVGSNNTCGDTKVSAFKAVGHPTLRQPQLADLGGGQFRVFWASGDKTLASQAYRGDGSRLHAEGAPVTAAMDLTDLRASTYAGGGHGL